MAQTTATKPWYKSKVALFALALVGVAGSNLLFGFLSVNVTPEQLDSIKQAYPQAVEIITRLKAGESIFSVLGAIVGVIIFVSRVWFTTSLIPQSLKK